MVYKNLKKRENTENLCLIIRGSQVQALVGPQITLPQFFVGGLFILLLTAQFIIFA